MVVKEDSKIIIRNSDGSEHIVENAVLFEKDGNRLTTTIRNVGPMELMVFGIRMLEALHEHSLLAMFIWGMNDEVEVKQVIRKALEK